MKLLKHTRSTLAGLTLAVLSTAALAETSSKGQFEVRGEGLNGTSSHQHSMYLKAGVLGAGVGYAYGLNERFTLRGEFTGMPSVDRSHTIDQSDYDLKLKNNAGTILVDYFPFDSGFRLSAGVGIRDTSLSGRTSNTTFRGVSLSSNDYLHAEVKWPTVAPYLGIGWGHNNGQKTKAGWGFVADAGVYYGRPSVSLNANASAMSTLNAATGGNGQSLIDQELDKWKGDVHKYKFFPALYVGVSYRF